MGIRFRKSVKILPGVRLNVSGSGVSTTLGGRGLSVNVGQRGTYLNAGIPGTGLSMRERLGASRPRYTAPLTGPMPRHSAITALLPPAPAIQETRFWRGWFARGLRRNRQSFLLGLVALAVLLGVAGTLTGASGAQASWAVVPVAALGLWALVSLLIQRLRDTGLPPWIGLGILAALCPLFWPGAPMAVGLLALWPSRALPVS